MMIRKTFTILSLLFVSLAQAQLNNSWIDYNKTYYKFKVASDGLCRIPQSTLAANPALANVNADYFQLWRNGSQVRLFTTISNAPLSPNDFIEFWGEMNDGKADKQLYLNPDFQLADKYSLETDTAAYFLTVNTTTSNLRFISANNTAPSTAIPDPYFMRDVNYYYKDYVNRGEARVIGEYVYSSSYDRGEGLSSNPGYAVCCDINKDFYNLHVFAGGPANSLSVRVNAAGLALNSRNLRIKLNQNDLTAAPYGLPISMTDFNYQKVNLTNLPLSLLPDPNRLNIKIGSTSTLSTDRFVVSSIGFTYPSIFNFSNASNFKFTLAPSVSGNYLVMDSFNFGNQPPILFDLTAGTRYLGDINSTPRKLKFVLPASTTSRDFILVSQMTVNSISNFITRDFINFSDVNNQAAYLIISNPVLYNDGNGHNYVEAYRQYRSSLQGGSFSSKIYDIAELTDQFGFGIKNHPAAIRDFIRFAHSNFNPSPEYVFIIGRGVDYADQRKNAANPILQQLNLVPTFGWPPSDILLAANPGKFSPLVPIGRLAAITGDEVNNYLIKIQQYESAQQSNSGDSKDKLWMKNFMHISGGRDSAENEQFSRYMNGYKSIAQDTLIGASVESFSKTTTGAVQQVSNQRIDDLFAQGLSFIGYFGHSSANTFEFNLSNPLVYNNAGKYPFFNVSGCSAGNYYTFDQLRIAGTLTLSEKYVLANQRGSIGFLADTHFGVPPYLNMYNTSLYKHFCQSDYGNSIGNQIKAVTQELGGLSTSLDCYTRMHLEEINLHGDPALKINYFSKPDYVIEDQMVKVNPSTISVADSRFNLKLKIYNIGKYVKDSLWTTVKLQLPNDSIIVLFKKLLPGFNNVYTTPYFPSTSYLLDTTINIAALNKGLNRIIIDLDTSNSIDELNEMNNTFTKELYIFPDELRPVYPSNFSIVNSQNITYSASTTNQFNGIRSYKMEIDTTELFNSPFKKSYDKNGRGGLVEFNPSDIIFTDSTVYYWRVVMLPLNSNTLTWNSSSFVYLSLSSPGYNQSHYYQFLKSNYNDITLDSSRQFKFKEIPQNLTIRTGLYPYFNYDRINVNLGVNQLEFYGCISGGAGNYNNMQFYVFDTLTLLPWRNHNVSATSGLYGSRYACPGTSPADTARAFFEYNYSNATHRANAMNFIDSIPNGMYVAITNLANISNTSFINQWMNDTLALGSGHSLYHKLKSIGFNQIDSFTQNLPFLYFFKKGNNTFPPTQIMGPTKSSYIDQTFRLMGVGANVGTIVSPVYGPARAWKSLHWRGGTTDADVTADSVKVQVWGTGNSGVFTLLSTMYPSQDTSLAFVDSPYIKLVVINKDQHFLTPNQLRYLRINADLLPEGAVSPAILFSTKDSVEEGESIDVNIAFKNISNNSFDSLLKVKLMINKSDNTTDTILIPKRKTLLPGDTITVHYKIDTRNFSEDNTWSIDFNPDNDQPEQFHYNNVWTNNFYIKKSDKYNPLLDVTFDGVHILNKDIVASKPHILIKLKDENRYLALDDTSLISLQIKFPDNSIHSYQFGDTMRFVPANLSSGENTASIEFAPVFAEDGDYELIVSGKDVSGNNAGSSNNAASLTYRVGFSVINKPMISNLLNYPNPFTTSTAFVFTVTGSEIPQNIRIQILTITGKVVREITKDELGPIHIGRNITEFKWDGTDSYGQKLANGVYIYRVLTNLNGKSLDKYTGDGDNTDKYFKKGYGKMYLMR